MRVIGGYMNRFFLTSLIICFSIINSSNGMYSYGFQQDTYTPFELLKKKEMGKISLQDVLLVKPKGDYTPEAMHAHLENLLGKSSLSETAIDAPTDLLIQELSRIPLPNPAHRNYYAMQTRRAQLINEVVNRFCLSSHRVFIQHWFDEDYLANENAKILTYFAVVNDNIPPLLDARLPFIKNQILDRVAACIANYIATSNFSDETKAELFFYFGEKLNRSLAAPTTPTLGENTRKRPRPTDIDQ